MPCRCSQLVQRAFHRELGDAGAGAAHPARRVGVQRRGLLVDPHVGAGIQFGRGFPGGLDELPGRALGQHRVLDQRRELAVRGGREADVLPGFAAERHHGEGVLAAEHQLDGSAHVLGRHGRQQQVRVGVLAAEAAHQRAQHAHLAVELEPAEQLADDAGQPVLQPEAERLAEDGGLAVGELRRHVDGQAAVGVPGREHGAGFHGVVVVVRRRREDQVHRVDRGRRRRACRPPLGPATQRPPSSRPPPGPRPAPGWTPRCWTGRSSGHRPGTARPGRSRTCPRRQPRRTGRHSAAARPATAGSRRSRLRSAPASCAAEARCGASARPARRAMPGRWRCRWTGCSPWLGRW